MIFGDVWISDEEADVLFAEQRALAERARDGCETYEHGIEVGRLQGWNSLATTLGIMPSITRAGHRRIKANKKED